MNKNKSFIVGFLISTFIFLFMGQTYEKSNNQRYHLNSHLIQGYNTIFYETVFDTYTGKIIDRKWYNEKDFEKSKNTKTSYWLC